jgi:hypothetical protein
MSAIARSTYVALMLGLVLSIWSCTNPPQSLAGEAGFVDAYFDAASLNSLLSDANCTHLRFYNARRVQSDTKGTAIAIGVKASGEPIYDGSTIKYRMYDRLASGTTPLTLLTKAEAVTRIGYVKSASEKSYAANFSKTDIVGLISAAGCNGIRLIPERSGTGWSMRMHPVKLSGSTININPAPPSVICGEPCPTYCGGTPAYYIHL